MDGIALATAIRARNSTIPIVLLSSAIIPDLDRQLVSTVLQKPILRAELYRRLHGLTLPAPVPALAPEPVPTNLRPMRVLTAEDNRTNQLVFRKMVQDLPIDLTFAGNGIEAVELFKSLQPDLIFMDISMPEMDGRDAARAIRLAEGGSARRTPIIALTAHAMDGDAENILAAGIDEYMTKPLRKTAILNALAAHCPKGAYQIEADQAAAS
jgi:CheY-like chemotaxis protein